MRSGFLILVLAFVSIAIAQDEALTKEAYTTPPQEIMDMVLAPRWQNISLGSPNPQDAKFAIAQSGGMPILANLGKPYYNLAGFQIDGAALRARSLTTGGSRFLKIFDLRSREIKNIDLPKGVTISSTAWSPDGKSLAFIANFEDGSRLCVADAVTGKTRIVSKRLLLATIETSLDWTPDNASIVCVLTPEPFVSPPQFPAYANEPEVRTSFGVKRPLRTMQGLLQTPFDMTLLEYFVTGQLSYVSVKDGKAKPIGKPVMIRNFDMAPDGKHFRITTTLKPFSYFAPLPSFGSAEELWDENGKALAEIRKTPMQTVETPTPATQTDERRALTWRPDGNGMSFLQMEPAPKKVEGETPPATPPKRRDRVMQWLPPYGKTDTKIIYESETRMDGIQYSADCQTLFVSDTDQGNGRVRAVYLSEPTKSYTVYTRKPDDFYNDPGVMVQARAKAGLNCVRISSEGMYLYLSGTQYSKNPMDEAPRPFVDRVTIKTGTKTRLWQSESYMYETIGQWLDDDFNEVIMNRQSRSVINDAWLVNMKSGDKKNLTNNKDYTPVITSLRRERIQITRVDGFKFWAEVTLPLDWKSGDKPPAFFWFYPNEFSTQKQYDDGLRNYNRNLFPTVNTQSKEFLCKLGYTFVEPDCPIVGPAGRMNDRYVPELRNSLSAIIDELDKRGFADRARLSIGGHSYGAFSALNAMVHTPYFKAGIAGSGAYNRTLTPNGFQSETRLIWEARETYLEMSPLLHTDDLNGAVLLTHGADDQNPGTFPINSERMFAALQANGKTAALYMYPYEDHGQSAKETVLDMWARWVAWLDKYVKNPKPIEPPKPEPQRPPPPPNTSPLLQFSNL